MPRERTTPPPLKRPLQRPRRIKEVTASPAFLSRLGNSSRSAHFKHPCLTATRSSVRSVFDGQYPNRSAQSREKMNDFKRGLAAPLAGRSGHGTPRKRGRYRETKRRRRSLFFKTPPACVDQPWRSVSRILFSTRFPKEPCRRRPFLCDARRRAPEAVGRAFCYATYPRIKRFGPKLSAYLALLPVGFALPLKSPSTRCALTAPFHPYPSTRCRSLRAGPSKASDSESKGGLFSVALSVGLAPVSRDCSALTLSSTVPCAVRTFLIPARRATDESERGRRDRRGRFSLYPIASFTAPCYNPFPCWSADGADGQRKKSIACAA